MKKAVIFDLDGTLTDTLSSIADTANAVLVKNNFPAQPSDAYKQFMGDGAKVLIERALKAAGDNQIEEHIDKMLGEYLELFQTGCLSGVKPFKNIPELLNELKEREIKICVLSNKPHPMTNEVVKNIFGENFFDIVQGQSDDIPPKPNQKGIQSIVKRLEVKAEECLYVGDSGVDMDTGNLAEMESVGVLWGFRDRNELEAHKAAYIIADPLELLKLL